MHLLCMHRMIHVNAHFFSSMHTVFIHFFNFFVMRLEDLIAIASYGVLPVHVNNLVRFVFFCLVD